MTSSGRDEIIRCRVETVQPSSPLLQLLRQILSDAAMTLRPPRIDSGKLQIIGRAAGSISFVRIRTLIWYRVDH